MRIGYHASHEQFAPSHLLVLAGRAAQVGFDALSCSDHIAPWSHAQGQSGYAWSWLGAAMQHAALPFAVVTAPGQRYHPVILAQAIATLGEMFPERLCVALGSGEALNEHVTGDPWPAKGERQDRLLASVDIIRRLVRGEEVTRDGPVRADRARLWTLPVFAPTLFGAALSVDTARWCGQWADGLTTVAEPSEGLPALIDAFRAGGGEGKPVHVHLKVSLGPTEDAALAEAFAQWRPNVLPADQLADLEDVDAFEAAAAHITPEDMHRSVLITADPARVVARLRELRDLGVEATFLHHVGRDQDRFIDAVATDVLPHLRAEATHAERTPHPG